MIFLGSIFFWNTVYTTCLSTHSINDPVSLGISFSTLHNTHKKRKWKIVAIAQGKTIGWKHGLRTPRESFFSKIWIFVAWARVSIQGVLGGLRRFSKIGHWGPVSVPVAQSRKIFWPNYQHYFGTVSPLSMEKYIWFIFLRKTLVFRSKTYTLCCKSIRSSAFLWCRTAYTFATECNSQIWYWL